MNTEKLKSFHALFLDFKGMTTNHALYSKRPNPDFLKFYKWISCLDTAAQISFMMYIWANWHAFSMDIINGEYNYVNFADMVKNSYLNHIAQL